MINSLSININHKKMVTTMKKLAILFLLLFTTSSGFLFSNSVINYQIEKPGGGEIYYSNEDIVIEWSCVDPDSVYFNDASTTFTIDADIYYWSLSSQTWTMIADSVPFSDESYTWTTPQDTLGDYFRIMLFDDNLHNHIGNISKTYFRIHTPPQQSGGPTIVEDKKQNDEIKIYPNPTSDKLIVKVSDSYKKPVYRLGIYNSQGLRVSKVFKPDKYNEIDVSFLPKGVYFVKIIIGGRLITKPIIILK